MQPAIMHGFELGTYMLPFAFGSPLCIAFWLFLLLGAAIQLLLLKKARTRPGKWGLALVLAAALLLCEVACQMITGWELLVPILLYFYLLTMLVGAGICAIVLRILQKRKTV